MQFRQRTHSADDEALAALYALEVLGGAERREFERHLGECAVCREIYTQDRDTLAQLLLASHEMAPSPGFRERLLRRADQELADR